MKYKNLLHRLILISYLLINVGSAEILSNGINLKDENRPWAADTFIMTYLNDSTQNEVITYYYLPNHTSVTITNTNGNYVGRLTSGIEFYINNEKENFDDFYLIVNNNNKFNITQKKIITLNKSTELKLKFSTILPPEVLSVDKNNTVFKFNADFNLTSNELFKQYVFRIPAANAQNIKLDFINSVLKDPYSNIVGAPVSAVHATNKYLEISYLFWNEGLRRQVVSDGERDSVGLRPNTEFHFQNIFSIEYDAIRVDWILQAVVAAIFIFLAFHGGKRWERKRLSSNIRKKPPE